jgi:hypothetical protein
MSVYAPAWLETNSSTWTRIITNDRTPNNSVSLQEHVKCSPIHGSLNTSSGCCFVHQNLLQDHGTRGLEKAPCYLSITIFTLPRRLRHSMPGVKAAQRT